MLSLCIWFINPLLEANSYRINLFCSLYLRLSFGILSVDESIVRVINYLHTILSVGCVCHQEIQEAYRFFVGALIFKTNHARYRERYEPKNPAVGWYCSSIWLAVKDSEMITSSCDEHLL